MFFAPSAAARRACTAALAGALLGACAALPGRLQAPRVAVVDVRPAQMRLLEQRYRVTLRVQNPNETPLEMRGLEFELDLNGRPFASGVSPQQAVIPAFGEDLVEVVVSSTIARIFEQIRALADRGDGAIRYRIRGSVAIGDGAARVPFQRAGRIDLRAPVPRRPGGTPV